MRTIIFILFSFFSGVSFAYDVCQPFHPSSNPNPALPCSYNGYDYDSLAVEAGVNSLFYKGEKYVLTDNDWWWSLTSPVYVTQDGILHAWGGWHPEYHTLSFSKDGALFFGQGASYVPPQLTVIIEPVGSLPGSVVSSPSGISCGLDPEICSAPMSQVSQTSLQATPNTGWVFSHWEETGNPYALATNTSANKMVIARFYRTFRNAATDQEGFRKAKDAIGGPCLEYVEYETGLPDDVCTYSAVNCLGQASVKGYATGSQPRVGAIVIYIQGDFPMNNGHAGIVASINEGAGTMVIHDSNWSNPSDGIVRDRTININDTGIMGYIYSAP